MGYCFGIDIGGTTVKIGLAAEDGALLEGWEIPTRREPTPESLLLDIRVSILDRLDRLDTKRTVKKAKADWTDLTGDWTGKKSKKSAERTSSASAWLPPVR